MAVKLKTFKISASFRAANGQETRSDVVAGKDLADALAIFVRQNFSHVEPEKMPLTLLALDKFHAERV